MPELHPIPGYPNYSITTDGRVWSAPRPRTRGGWLKQFRSGRYMQVSLRSDGKTRPVRVHVLMALTFLGPRPDGLEVRHLDDDPINNRIENLAYGTQAENMSDRVRNGRHHHSNKIKCPQGHLYRGENLRIDRRGARHCRTCDRSAARK